MPTIDYEVGFTLNINPAKNEYMRMYIKVAGIDASLPIEPQLESAHVGLHQTMAWANEQILNKIEAETGKEWK